jgi:hypothetical protein
MTCILIYSSSLASQLGFLPRFGCLPSAVPRFRRPIPSRHTSPRLFPVSPQAPRREYQAAPGGTAVLCFGFAALRVLVPPTARAPSKKARLGTWEQPSLPSVPAECPE